MDLFLREAADRIGADDVLRKIDRLMNWQSFLPILKRGLKRTGIGLQGYDPLVLFKCLLIGQWHGLSDPKLERGQPRHASQPSPRRDHGQSGGKSVRGCPLRASEKRFNTLIPKRRFRVEHCFGTMRCLLGSVFLAFIVHDILDWPKHTPNWQWPRTKSK
jgi:IS5 family transposase